MLYGKCKEADTPFFDVLYHELAETLTTIDRDGGNTIETSKRATDLATQALEQLRSHVVVHGFTTVTEEIEFFKVCKPAIEHLRLYYHLLFDMALNCVVPGSWDEPVLQDAQEKIRRFYLEHTFLIKYYRGGATYLDDRFFVRTPMDGTWMPLNARCDTVFHAACDHFVAMLLAYEKLQVFINDARRERSAASADKTGEKFKWTDSKAALIELLYALQRKGSINNGQADLKDIARFFEMVFGIDLGNYYRTFQEIRIRKSGRTNYLDQLKSVLLGYMDETDLQYKG